MRVGVKFCGNCNPFIDTGAVLQELKAQADGVVFVPWDDDSYSVLLVLSSCGKDCATRPAFAGPVIEVTDTSIDRQPVGALQLPAAILAALRTHADRDPHSSTAPRASPCDEERVRLSGAIP
jgi:hypothetical protein